MANEAENAIYSRLSSAPTHHPASASLFVDDWGLEPGDVVTVTSGEDSYSLPIYSLDLKWNGASRVEAQATGNRKRPPLPELSRKQYGAASRAYGNYAELEEEISEFNTEIQQTNREILLRAYQVDMDNVEEILRQAGISINEQGVLVYADDNVNMLGARFNVQAGEISSLVTKTGVNSLGQGETLYSKVTQTESEISSEVTRATGAEGTLSSRITQNANSISLVVDNNGVKAASIMAAINGDQSTVKISADKIEMDGWLQAHAVTVDGLYSKNNLLADGWVVARSYVNAGTDVQINNVSLKTAVVSFGTASASGGQITIPTTTFGGTAGPSITFNIADTAYYQSGVSAARTTGWDAARGKLTWPSTGTNESMDIVYPTSTYNGSSTKHYYLTAGGWGSGYQYVYLRPDTTTDPPVARTTIYMPSSATFGVTIEGPAGANGRYNISCTVGGKTYNASGTWVG